MLARIPRCSVLPRYRSLNHGKFALARRALVSAPKAGDGPLLERRADRELPDIPRPGLRWLRTAPLFLVVLAASTLAIFNYQKASSPVVSSTMYALRTSPKAREVLGGEVYFAHKMPWIWGEMNQLHGRIDIQFQVKGGRETATMRFTSRRPTRRGMFETSEWSLTTRQGDWIDLLEDREPFQMLELEEEERETKVAGRGLYAPKIDK